MIDIRKKLNLTQKKFAELMGVSILTVMRWEKNGKMTKVLERAFRDLESELGGGKSTPVVRAVSGKIVIPHDEELILKKQAGRDWDEIKYGNPGDERGSAWVGLLKYAARVHGGNYKAYYESELARYGRQDGDVAEWS